MLKFKISFCYAKETINNDKQFNNASEANCESFNFISVGNHMITATSFLGSLERGETLVGSGHVLP